MRCCKFSKKKMKWKKRTLWSSTEATMHENFEVDSRSVFSSFATWQSSLHSARRSCDGWKLEAATVTGTSSVPGSTSVSSPHLQWRVTKSSERWTVCYGQRLLLWTWLFWTSRLRYFSAQVIFFIKDTRKVYKFRLNLRRWFVFIY